MNIYHLQLQFETTIDYKQFLVDLLHTCKTRHELYEEVFSKWLDKHGYIKNNVSIAS